MSGDTTLRAEGREMPSVNLGHWGALAAVLTGVSWMVTGIVYLLNPEYWDFASSFDYLNIAAEGAAQLMMLGGLAGLHVRHAGSYGRLGAVGFYAAFAGTVLGTFGNLGGIPDFGIVGLANAIYIPGVLIQGIGLVLLGAAMLRAKTLPPWSGPALAIGLVALWVLGANGGWLVFGLAWLALGFAISSSTRG